MNAPHHLRRYGGIAVATGLVGITALPLACSSSSDKSGIISVPKRDSSTDGSGMPDGHLFGGDSTVGGNTDSGLGGPDGSCGQSVVQAQPKEVNVLLVIDRSGSMADKPTGFTTDKWAAMKTALGTALGAVQDDISFGLELFPYPADVSKPIPVQCGSNCCEMPPAPGIQVPVDKGTVAVPKITAALTMGPGGGTPTAAALQRAYDYFKTGAGKGLTGDKYVLLATDGGPDCASGLSCDATQCVLNLDGNCPKGTAPDGGIGNCCDPQFGGAAAVSLLCLDDTNTTAKITQLAGLGVKTFVVGIPGSEAYSNVLDAFAQAGGEVNPAAPPKYYAVKASGGAAGLTDVLTSITKQLITSCRQQLQSDPQDLTKLNVKVDGVLIPSGGANGWILDVSTSPPTVVLQGTTCTQVKTKGAQSVQVVFGCPTVE